MAQPARLGSADLSPWLPPAGFLPRPDLDRELLRREGGQDQSSSVAFSSDDLLVDCSTRAQFSIPLDNLEASDTVPAIDNQCRTSPELQSIEKLAARGFPGAGGSGLGHATIGSGWWCSGVDALWPAARSGAVGSATDHGRGGPVTKPVCRTALRSGK